MAGTLQETEGGKGNEGLRREANVNNLQMGRLIKKKTTLEKGEEKKGENTFEQTHRKCPEPENLSKGINY